MNNFATMSPIYKLEHSFAHNIRKSLQDSCKDRKVKKCVNFICKDGVVSCDNTLLAFVSNTWKTILMTTNADTNYIIAPDYSVKFMRNYLLSCSYSCNTAKEDNIGYHCDANGNDLENYDDQTGDDRENDLENYYDQTGDDRENDLKNCDDQTVNDRENDLENYDDQKGDDRENDVRNFDDQTGDDRESDLENYDLKVDASEDDLENYGDTNIDNMVADLENLNNSEGKLEQKLENSKGNPLVIRFLDEFIETLLEVCVQDDEEHIQNKTRFATIQRKVKKIKNAFKSPLIDTFKVKEKSTCSICLKQFSRPSNCKEHMKECYSKEIKYQCDKCEANFKTKKGLATHIKYSHENESKDPFICNICGRVFLYKRSLIRHCKEEQHSSYPKSDKTKVFKWGIKTGVKCTICHKMIASYALDIHMENYHCKEARVFKCKICDFKTNREYSLKRHYRDVHQRTDKDFCAIKETFVEGVSKYQCPECKEILSSIDEVEDHLVGKICSRTCNICKKTFSRKDNLKQHKKRVHK